MMKKICCLLAAAILMVYFLPTSYQWSKGVHPFLYATCQILSLYLKGSEQSFVNKRMDSRLITLSHRAAKCDFQQCGILTSVELDEPLQPSFKLRNSKWCSLSSLTPIEYSCNKQWLWSDCPYMQADLRLCWSHITNCWKSHVSAQILLMDNF